MQQAGGINLEDMKRLDRLLTRVPEEMAEQLRRAYSKGIRRFKNHFVETRLSGPPGLRRGRHTSPASWPVYVSPKGGDIDLVHAQMWSIYPWMNIHEEGGTIFPRRRQYLAIPISREYGGGAMTKGGALRGAFVRLAPPRLRDSQGKFLPSAQQPPAPPAGERTLYAVPGLFPFTSKKGNLLLGMRRGTTLIPMFSLKRSVTLKPRLQFKETFKRWAGGSEMAGILRGALDKTMKTVERKYIGARFMKSGRG